MRTHLLATTAVMALLSASTVSTRAQTLWTGAISSDWFTAGNWSGGVPTIGTGAFINNTTVTATVDGAAGAAAAAQFVTVGQFGASSLTIQNGGTLTTFTGLVGQPNGRGDVTVTGPGSLWTNFNSLQVGGGQQGSIGTLTVADGGIVNGSFFFGTPITVGGGAGGFGVLRGDGIVTSTQINARGILAPGVFLAPGLVGTPGAMSVFGSLAFQSGAFYVVQVNPTTASTTNVNLTASLAGTVAAVFAPGTYVALLHDFDGRERGHRHVRRARHLRPAARLPDQPELYRQYRIT